MNFNVDNQLNTRLMPGWLPVATENGEEIFVIHDRHRAKKFWLGWGNGYANANEAHPYDATYFRRSSREILPAYPDDATRYASSDVINARSPRAKTIGVDYAEIAQRYDQIVRSRSQA